MQSAERLIASLDDLEREGCQVVRADPDRYWQQHVQLERDSKPFVGMYPHLESLHDADVVLGFLGGFHLGDIVCVTSLVRMLALERQCRVYVVRHRGSYKVFENNPHLKGFRNEGRMSLNEITRGPGHIIQKLTRAFGLPLQPIPRGEIHLSDAEQKWAWSMRASLPRNRPVAVVCAGSVTDNTVMPTQSLEWQTCVNILARYFTVIQIVVTRMSVLEEVMRPLPGHVASFRPDRILDNCFVLENLPARHFFSVFSIASLFVGTNTGSAHVAAAFSVPSIVLLGSRKYPKPPVFPDSSRWHHESFLYPQHSFVMCGG
jgi:ADP-heptose:LPS heptosyltransferase